MGAPTPAGDNREKGLMFKMYGLDPTKSNWFGKASRKALRVFADEVEGTAPKLAAEIRTWVWACENGDYIGMHVVRQSDKATGDTP